MKDTPLTLNASAAEGRSDLFSFFFLGGFAPTDKRGNSIFIGREAVEKGGV